MADSTPFRRNFLFVSPNEEDHRKARAHAVREVRRERRWRDVQAFRATTPVASRGRVRFEWSSRHSLPVVEQPHPKPSPPPEKPRFTQEEVAVHKSSYEALLEKDTAQTESIQDKAVSARSKGPADLSLIRSQVDPPVLDALSALPIALKDGDRPLVNHLFKIYPLLLFGSQNHQSSHAWTNIASFYTISPAFLHSMLAQAACQLAALQGRPAITSQSSYHLWKSHQLTNQGLQDPQQQYSDDMLAAVLGLAIYESRWGNPRMVRKHLRGVDKLLEGRSHIKSDGSSSNKQVNVALNWTRVSTSGMPGAFDPLTEASLVRLECDFLLTTLLDVWQYRQETTSTCATPTTLISSVFDPRLSPMSSDTARSKSPLSVANEPIAEDLVPLASKSSSESHGVDSLSLTAMTESRSRKPSRSGQQQFDPKEILDLSTSGSVFRQLFTKAAVVPGVLPSHVQRQAVVQVANLFAMILARQAYLQLSLAWEKLVGNFASRLQELSPIQRSTNFALLVAIVRGEIEPADFPPAASKSFPIVLRLVKLVGQMDAKIIDRIREVLVFSLVGYIEDEAPNFSFDDLQNEILAWVERYLQV